MIVDDELPIFRPQFGRRKKSTADRAPSFRAAMLAGVRLRSGGALGRARRAFARLRIAAPPPGALSRRAIVKASFVRLGPYGAKAAALHLAYIQRNGVDGDGRRGRLYGPDGAERADTFREPRPGERCQYRWVVSPEDAEDLDLTAYVRRLMAQVEKDTGRPLEWAAVNHYDTVHPHAHVVIRGVDKGGQPLRFERAYISQGLRRRAQELATRELGLRTEFDLHRQRSREITQDRCTSLDRALERRAKGRIVTLPSRPRLWAAPARWAAIDPSTLRARLEHLERLRLAERLSPHAWQLAEGFTAHLRDLGARADILVQMHRALRGDPARYRILAPGEPLPDPEAHGSPFTLGRIAQKGLSDELRGSFYALVETPNGTGYHVPLDQRSAETLREGDLVTLGHPHSAQGAAAKPPPVLLTPAPGLEQQVHAPDPVLLDELHRDTLAPRGFGADLRHALDRRDQTLRRFGIDPTDPERVRKLRNLNFPGRDRER